jgi:hypothetical protein
MVPSLTSFHHSIQFPSCPYAPVTDFLNAPGSDFFPYRFVCTGLHCYYFAGVAHSGVTVQQMRSGPERLIPWHSTHQNSQALSTEQQQTAVERLMGTGPWMTEETLHAVC